MPKSTLVISDKYAGISLQSSMFRLLRVLLLVGIIAVVYPNVWVGAVSINPASPLSSGSAPSSISPSSTANVTAQWASWHASMSKIPTPGTGCFEANYPNLVWQPTPCAAPTSGHAGPSPTFAPTLSGGATVGNGNDFVAQSPSTLIGNAIGSFPSVTGLTSENDVCVGPPPFCTVGGAGADAYSLQVNSQGGNTAQAFPVTFMGNPTTGWEQFVFDNEPSGFRGVWIEFWLFGYSTAYLGGGACSALPVPAGASGSWFGPDGAGDCYFNSNAVATPNEPPSTSLSLLSLEGSANVGGGGNDEAILCVSGGSCYTNSQAGFLSLYQQWTLAEFNVIGFISGSQAQFNSGTSITVLNALTDSSGNPITPVSPCPNNGQTGETNNLNLADCSSSSSGMEFNEGNVPQVTETLSYQTPGGAGTSIAPTFNYVWEGSSATYTLTTTPTPISADSGTAWSVTPNPLACSSCTPSSERWQSIQVLSGTSTGGALLFLFYHQYLQTLSYSITPVSNPGSPTAPTFTALWFGISLPLFLTQSATGYWYDAGSSWTVTNPLTGSTPTQRWYTLQSTSGTVSSAQTIAFIFHHQFFLTVNVLPSALYGSTAPGSGWNDYNSPVSVMANANAGYSLGSWTTSGVSCSGGPTSNPCTFNMPLNPATLTANFVINTVYVNLHLATYKIVNVQVQVLQGSTVVASTSVTLSYASPNAQLVFTHVPSGTLTVRISGYSFPTQTKAETIPPSPQTVNFIIR